MDFEWNEQKRQSNIEKHKLDFADCDILFAGSYAEVSGKTVGGEQRRMAIGMIGDVYLTAIYTVRGSVIRIISLRKARNDEKTRHRALFGS